MEENNNNDKVLDFIKRRFSTERKQESHAALARGRNANIFFEFRT